MNKNITLRQLRAFVAVAELGSFTAAAGRMHLTQSALSVLVRELERELGARLFDRHTRRVLMTEAGHELLPYATRVLAELEQAASSVAGLRDKRRGRLRLAVPQLMASTLGARADRRVPPPASGRGDRAARHTDRPAGGAGVVGRGRTGHRRRSAFQRRHPASRAAARPPLARLPDGTSAGRRASRCAGRTWPTSPSSRPTRDFVRWLEPLLAPRGLLPVPAHTVAYVSTALGLVGRRAGRDAGAQLRRAAGAGLGAGVAPTGGTGIRARRADLLRAGAQPDAGRDSLCRSAAGTGGTTQRGVRLKGRPRCSLGRSATRPACDPCLCPRPTAPAKPRTDARSPSMPMPAATGCGTSKAI